MSRLNLAAAAISVGGLLLTPGLAEAHYQLVAPNSWWTQASDGSPQKTPPCGDEVIAGQSATNAMNVYTAGQSVTVTVTATIAHPGWWRISLRQGAASTQNQTNFPDPPELGAPGSAQQCTPAFIANPVWSPTQPVIADKLGIPANSPNSTTTVQSGTQNYQVMIPAAAQCSMANPCTLQVLMIMTDHTFPTCNYHHCANMALAGSATGSGGMTGTDAGTSGQGGASSGTGGKTGAGGSTTTGAGGSTTTGAGGATTAGAGGMTASGSGGSPAGEGGSTGGGQDSGTDGGAGSSNNGCSCAVGGSVAGSSSGLLLVALLALRRRRKK